MSHTFINGRDSFVTNTLNMRKSFFYKESELKSRIENGDDFWNVIEIEGKDIEQKNFVEFFVNHSSLTKMEKLIMKLIYLADCSQTEVGKACGLSASRISQIQSNLMVRFRALDYSKVI